MNGDYNWYVVKTKPRSEYRAKQELINQGYETYLPEIQLRRLVRGKECLHTEALFKGYLFIRLSRFGSCWSSVRSTRGVSGLIAFGDSDPSPVPDGVVDMVRYDCCVRDVEPRLRQGDYVSINLWSSLASNATELFGKLVSLDGEGRAFVLLALLGRENSIRIETRQLTLA